MEHETVVSSNIDSIGFDPETQTLEVRFKHGGTYSYDGVAATTFEQFRSATSPGKFFLANIKGQYSTRKA